MKFAFALMILLANGIFAAGADDTTPPPKKIPEEIAPVVPSPSESNAPKTSVKLVLGNESNKPDGVFGPFTWGGNASHDFTNGFSVEAGYVRLHERGTPIRESFVDEAQLTILLPETNLTGSPVRFGVTAWKNRMMDMYTNVGGIEASREGRVTLNAGLYAGTATREEESGRFFGAQLGATVNIGRIEFTLAEMAGAIRTPGDRTSFGLGRFSKTAIEAATDFFPVENFPITVSFAVERRAFDFGNEGSANDPDDTYIGVTELKIPLYRVPKRN